MTVWRRFPALVAAGLAVSLVACSVGPSPGVLNHGLVSLECGPAGGGFPALELSHSPLACDEPRGARPETLVARTIGGAITESDDGVRYDVTSGELCTGSTCVRVVAGWIELARDPRAAEATYSIELDDGSFAGGSVPVTLCPASCL